MLGSREPYSDISMENIFQRRDAVKQAGEYSRRDIDAAALSSGSPVWPTTAPALENLYMRFSQ